MARKRQLASIFPARRRLQLLAFRDAGGHGGREPVPAVAVSNGGVVALSSLTGLSWTNRTIPSVSYTGGAWNGALYAVVGSGGSAATSPNGKDWTARTLAAPTGGAWRRAAWNGAVFCTISQGGTDTATSPDGDAWTVHAGVLPSSAFSDIASDGVQFVIVGSSGITSTSLDGITWTGIVSITGAGNGNASIGWSEDLGIFAVGTVGTRMATSPDGLAWTARVSPVDWQLGSEVTVWSPDLGRFLNIGGANGGVAGAITSPDGAVWTARPSLDSGKHWVSAAAYKTVLLAGTAAGGGTIASSSDVGVTWVEQVVGLTPSAITTPRVLYDDSVAFLTQPALLIPTVDGGLFRYVTGHPNGGNIRIDVSTDNGATYTTAVAAQAPGTNIITLTGLTAGTAYQVKIRATPLSNPGGGSAVSNAVALTPAANALVNSGFETVTGSDWNAGGAAGVRIGTDGGVTPIDGSFMLKEDLSAGTFSTQQIFSGTLYRASAGTATCWVNSSVAIAAASDARAVYLYVLAFDVLNNVLGSVQIAISGGGAAFPGIDVTQSGALEAATWTKGTIDVRTTLDAAIGVGNLPNVDYVAFLLRIGGTNFVAYWDDIFF
jgi:hypothetical protein